MLQRARVEGRDQPVTLINAGVVAESDGPAVQGPVPRLGEHTEAVLREAGYSDADIDSLCNMGVI